MTPETIKLNIANRKIVRLKKENDRLINKFINIRMDYIQLLKIIASDSDYSLKIKIQNIIKDLESQDE